MESTYNYSAPDTPKALVKANPVVRSIAFIIDVLVSAIPYYLFLFLHIYILVFYVAPIIMFGYLMFRDALPLTGGFLGGQSIGKKLMNIKAVKEGTGESLLGDYGTSAFRQLPAVLFPFTLYEAALMFAGDDKTRLGDKWAHTTVVKA